MKIIIDIGHPAHVHLFRFLADELTGKGWKVLMTVREKDQNVSLIKQLDYSYKVYGTTVKNIFFKVFSMFSKTIMLFWITLKFRPDITISHSSFYLSQVSWLLRIPNITLEDTGNMEQVRLYLPFTSVMLTPSSYKRKHGKKQIGYQGFHELAYLHPNVKSLLFKDYQDNHINPGRPVILLRLVSWSASHDMNRKGIGQDFIVRFIKEFEPEAQIFISAECHIPEALEKYRIGSGTVSIHSILEKTDLYVGEGATMASECALLGIPAIYINDIQADTIEEQANSGLIFQTTDENEIFAKTRELLSNSERREVFQNKAQELISRKIDVTAFLVWFIENYPESARIMRQNPEYQERFKLETI